MLLIYSNKHTNRTRYIFSLMFTEILGIETEYTSDEEEYNAYEGPRLNYSEEPERKGVYFRSTDLLFERGISDKELTFIDHQGIPVFFPVYDDNSVMPFDPFAAGFYLVSRYEEYLPYVRDEYGRFQAQHSIAFQKGFLTKPVVNIWACQVYEILKRTYPGLKQKSRKFRFLPTIDMNAAYFYKLKGAVRTVGGILQSLGELNLPQVRKRLSVLMGMDKDPFDTYEEQLDLHKKYELETIYFILFAEYGHNDKNISVNNRKFHILIKTLGDYCRVGLHSSFASLHEPARLRTEVERLSSVLNREVELCRQHFLVLNIPMTYRNMLNLDIKEDFSMGYVNTPGFRAGICVPFYFYDLDIDAVTNLKINPFVVMDAPVLYNGMKLKDYRPIIDEVKRVNGTLVSIWNNESLAYNVKGKNGIGMYEELIKMVLETSAD